MSLFPPNLNRAERRAYAREAAQFIDKQRVGYGDRLEHIPRDEWPAIGGDNPPVRVMRSRDFMVQIYNEPGGIVRLSANRIKVTRDGKWVDGITWDELQRLKREAGFGTVDAVEVYPPDCDVVNVANIRHLWVLPQALEFAWRKS